MLLLIVVLNILFACEWWFNTKLQYVFAEVMAVLIFTHNVEIWVKISLNESHNWKTAVPNMIAIAG